MNSEIANEWARYFSLIAACFLMCIYLYYLFYEREPRRRSDFASSFLYPVYLMSSARLRALASCFALPTAALLAYILSELKPLVDALKLIIANAVKTEAPSEYGSALVQALNALPDSVDPLVIIIATAFLFMPVVRAPLVFFRNAIYYAYGIDNRSESFARAAASSVLAKESDDEAAIGIARSFNSSPPLPVKLIRCSDSIKLAYQILFFSREETAKSGLDIGIERTLEKINISHRGLVTGIRIRPIDFLTAVVIYFIFCCLYFFIVPTMSHPGGDTGSLYLLCLRY